MAHQYTPEEQAAAWAAYYAQQGYTVDPSAGSSSGGAGYHTPYDPEAAQQASAYQYNPQPEAEGGGYMADGKWVSTPAGQGSTQAGKGKSKDGKEGPRGKRETVIRKAGGKVWEDQTLLEWDPSWFRLFVGDLSNDVNDNTLNAAFAKYPSYCKCKVVRDRLSDKAKYGFIAFTDPEDFLKAWKEMDGKYVGNRPIRLMKVNEKQHGGIRKVNIGHRKAKELDKLAKNKGKPLNGRPTAF